MLHKFTIYFGNQKLYVKGGFQFSLKKTSKDGFVLLSLHL